MSLSEQVSPSNFSVGINSLTAYISCRVAELTYKESYTSLRMLKSLRHIVDSLAEDLDKKITQVEEAVLPASRYRGLVSLPSELIVNIMNLAGARSHMDIVNLEKLREVFLDVEPFKAHIGLAPMFRRDWRKQEGSWSGTLPPLSEMGNITKLYLLDAANVTPRVFAAAMREMRSLQHLEIN